MNSRPASLVYTDSEIQDSQSYLDRPCLNKTKQTRKNDAGITFRIPVLCLKISSPCSGMDGNVAAALYCK